MVEFLKNWSLQIVIVTLFVTFIELILPNGSTKNYVKIITGLLLIIVIVNPFINIFNTDINIDKEIFLNVNQEVIQKTDENDKLAKENNRQIIQIYKNKLKTEVLRIIEEETEYTAEIKNMDIIEDFQNDRFGNIEKLTICLNDVDKQNEQKSKQVKVKEVVVNVKKVVQSDKVQDNREFQDVKETISNTYDIPKENIIVYVKK